MSEDTYQIIVLPSAAREFKKLPRDVRNHVVDSVQVLATDPHAGGLLHGRWHFLRSLHTIYRRTHYRIAYEVDSKHRNVLVHYAASRENFYRKLHKVKLKPLAQ